MKIAQLVSAVFPQAACVMAMEYGVEVSPSALGGFWQHYCAPLRLRRAADAANALPTLSGGLMAEWDEANVALGYEEDERDYSVAAQMLRAVGAPRIELLTNNPDKVFQLRRLGVDVVRRVPTGLHLSPANARYLAAKAQHGARRITGTA